MSGLKRIAGSLNVINLILSSVLLLFILFLFLPAVHKGTQYTLPEIKRSSSISGETEAPPAEKSPSPTDYIIVADKNVFHPERKIPVEKKAEAPLPKPDFILYGTLITDEAAIAYMEDAKATVTTPGRGKRQSSVSLGETLSGFTLKTIDSDRVTMVRGEESIVVRLDDPQNPKKRETADITSSKPQAGGQTAQATQAPPSGTAAFTPARGQTTGRTTGASSRASAQQPQTPQDIPSRFRNTRGSAESSTSRPSAAPTGGGLFGLPRK